MWYFLTLQVDKGDLNGIRQLTSAHLRQILKAAKDPPVLSWANEGSTSGLEALEMKLFSWGILNGSQTRWDM